MSKQEEQSMNKKNILVVSNAETMKPELLEWISNEDKFDMTFADTHEKAIELSNQQLFDLVLIDKTDENVNVKKLGAILPIFNAETLLVGYEGEGKDEIEEKIKLAFEYRKFKRMQKMMILDSSVKKRKNDGLMPFSLN
jgi:hypothetical protein